MESINLTNVTYDDLNEVGVNALMIAIIEQTRKDYINGYIKMKERFGTLITKQEFEEWKFKHKRKNMGAIWYNFCKIIEGYFSSIDFINMDPYDLFKEKQSLIFRTLNEEAEEKIAENSAR